MLLLKLGWSHLAEAALLSSNVILTVYKLTRRKDCKLNKTTMLEFKCTIKLLHSFYRNKISSILRCTQCT